MRYQYSRPTASSFSFAGAIAMLADPQVSDYTANLPDDIVESSRRAEHGFSSPRGPGSAVVVPWHHLVTQRRDLNLGGSAVALTGSLRYTAKDALSGFSVVVGAGVNVVDVPPGNAPSLSVVSADPTATWATAEGAGVAAGEPSFGLVAFTPRTVGLHFTVTRRLLASLTPANEAAILKSVLRAIGRAVDAAVLAGTGSGGQPQGLATLSGVFNVAGSGLAHAGVQSMIASCLAAGAREENIMVVAAPAAFEVLSKRERAAGSGFIWDAGRVAGRPAAVSIDAPANSMFAGDFALIDLAVHGGLTLIVDRFTYATAGAVRIVLLLDLEVFHSHPQAFARAASIS